MHLELNMLVRGKFLARVPVIEEFYVIATVTTNIYLQFRCTVTRPLICILMIVDCRSHVYEFQTGELPCY